MLHENKADDETVPDLLTAEAMRAVEGAAIASGRVSGAALMEAAGAGVAARLCALWPEGSGGGAGGARRAEILVGPGNNGGDGLVIARHLAGAGWAVRLCAEGTPPPGGDAAAARARWEGAVLPLAEAGRGPVPDVVVDALFGTGLARPLPEPVAQALARAAARAPLVAVDLLSGIDADTGRALWPGGVAPVAALRSFAFEAMKRGHVLGAGGTLSGVVEVVDLCLAPERAAARAAARAASGRDAVPAWARLVSGPEPGAGALAKGVAGHKYAHGAVLVLAGGPGRGGAARLAARAALRVGAGLVTLVCPPEALAENAARLDAVMLRPARSRAALAALLAERRLGALVAGPGLGLARARRVVPPLCARGLPLVLDADALTGFAAGPGVLFGHLHPGVVLTPHWGEFARLWPDLAAAVAEGALSSVDAAGLAAERAGAVVLLKGAASVIAAPGEGARVVALTGAQAAPWLATAGSGDVLAGLVAGLMARGLAPADAAATGAWLHGAAGRSCGPGLIAEDLPEALPALLAGLLSAP